LQFGELRIPQTPGPHPIAIVIHGGCWLAKLGTMDPTVPSRSTTCGRSPTRLTEAGIAHLEHRVPPDRYVPAAAGQDRFAMSQAAADFLRTIAANEAGWT
jgi:hypothetical protein